MTNYTYTCTHLNLHPASITDECFLHVISQLSPSPLKHVLAYYVTCHSKTASSVCLSRLVGGAGLCHGVVLTRKRCRNVGKHNSGSFRIMTCHTENNKPANCRLTRQPPIITGCRKVVIWTLRATYARLVQVRRFRHASRAHMHAHGCARTNKSIQTHKDG